MYIFDSLQYFSNIEVNLNQISSGDVSFERAQQITPIPLLYSVNFFFLPEKKSDKNFFGTLLLVFFVDRPFGSRF